ncbi:MAG TPA: glycosyltransferase [Firmicutes bacterium]|nr:glycosyltransferase [Bacillota bacterium]
MRITVVCDILGEENNGTTVTTMNLVRSLRAKGHTVNILCCDEDKLGKEGYFVCPTRSFGPFNGYVRHVGVTLAKPDERTVRAAVECADIVHCMLPFALTKAAIRMARELDKPVTAGFHCQAENFSSYVMLKNCRPVNNYVYRLFYDKVFGVVDCVHYPSQFIRDLFERKTAPTKGVVISNGVAEHFRPEKHEKPRFMKDKFVIVSTGRYSNEKCQSVLIKAVGLSKHRDDIRLVLAGKGVLDKKFCRLAEKYKLKDPMFRFFARDEMLDILAYSDLYVHPADAELEGIAVLEAIKCGKPIVVADSDRSAPKALARDERNLFRSGSAKDLAARIDYWIEHPAELAECADYYAHYEGVESASDCMDRMERMFADVIAAYRRVPAGEEAYAALEGQRER